MRLLLLILPLLFVYCRQLVCQRCWGTGKPCNITAAEREAGYWCMSPLDVIAYEKRLGKELHDPHSSFVPAGSNLVNKHFDIIFTLLK
jgi:hypothetical protein